jgi:hypothetical protein
MADPKTLASVTGAQSKAADIKEASMPTPDPKEIDVALRRYDVVFRYFATENMMSWTKNQFFLAANAGLIAFASARFPKDTIWTSLLAPAIITIIGLLFSILWLFTLRGAVIHVDWWKRICLQLEPIAFGPHEVLRGVPRTGVWKITRTIARAFVVVWSGAALALLIVFFAH